MVFKRKNLGQMDVGLEIVAPLPLFIRLGEYSISMRIQTLNCSSRKVLKISIILTPVERRDGGENFSSSSLSKSG